MEERWGKRIAARERADARSQKGFANLLQMTRLAVAALGMLALPAAQSQVVKCVDAKGRVEYAKVCPPGTNEAGQINKDAPPTPAPAPRAAAAPAGMARSVDGDPALLDQTEDNICFANVQLAGARRAYAGPESTAPGAVAASQKMLDGYVKQYANYQAEYRRLTGGEFNTALCDDKERRFKRREAWDAKRRDDALNQRADQLMANEADGVGAICRQLKAMDPPPQDQRGSISPETLQDIQDSARASYGRLVASYERIYNKDFNPARCR